jgi:type I restriction enzyme S subunit
MKKEKLNSILISLESGGRPKGGAIESGIPSIGAEHLNDDGTVKTDIKKFVPEDYFNNLKSGIIKKEDILIVKDGATTGKVSFINKDYPLNKVAVNEHVFIIRIDQNKAFPKYVFNYLRSVEGQKAILSDFRGATVGGISRKIGEVVLVPLPPLEEQKHIAVVLSKAEALIAERKQSIQLLDEYLKSTFLEMFGDPVKNEKGWEKVKLENIASKITDGKHGDCINEENSGYYFLSAKDLIDGELKYNDVRQITKVDFDEVDKRTSLKVNDILLGNTGASIGKIGIVRNNEFVRKTVFQKSISVITLKTDICAPIYLKSYLEVDRGLFNKTSTGSAMPNLLLSQIRNFQILVPTLKLQTQFAQIVEKTEALKAQYKGHLQELEQLYGALSQRAFRGEMNIKEIKHSV